MKWLLLAAAWIAYGLAFCLIAGPGAKDDEIDDWIIPKPIDQVWIDERVIADLLKEFNPMIWGDHWTTDQTTF